MGNEAFISRQLVLAVNSAASQLQTGELGLQLG
jgi:hypothetical protein